MRARLGEKGLAVPRLAQHPGNGSRASSAVSWAMEALSGRQTKVSKLDDCVQLSLTVASRGLARE